MGIAGGPSLIYLRGNEFLKSNAQANLGYSGGATVEYKFNSVFSLLGNVFYERKGAKAHTIFTDNLGNIISEGNLLYNFDYLTLPVLARLTVGQDKFKAFFNVGPYLGILIRHRTKFSDATVHIPNTESTQAYSRLDFGITSGIGLALPINEKLNFTVESRYNFGIKNINNMPFSSEYAINTTSVNALVGLTYAISKK